MQINKQRNENNELSVTGDINNQWEQSHFLSNHYFFNSAMNHSFHKYP